MVRLFRDHVGASLLAGPAREPEVVVVLFFDLFGGGCRYCSGGGFGIGGSRKRCSGVGGDVFVLAEWGRGEEEACGSGDGLEARCCARAQDRAEEQGGAEGHFFRC